ncbi:patatin-like protein [Novosphingobium sp.]|uniref:patatin-like protein n=1 Tax=Novosphingobium sp. TaxID=1874826 RepID=UPI0025FFA245|nr:patatin-like protein [Novosphingobium sp.]
MRQKELRIALVCYGGVSLAVYMHGVTKELWHAVRASRAHHARQPSTPGVEAVYRELLETIGATRDLKLRVLLDIVAGASAGGMNGVFLAQAIANGQSLEPLTRLWLEKADIEVLLDPDAKPWSRLAKFWAQPLVWLLLKRPGNVVSGTVAPETRNEVRRKVSALIRARWFAPPFSGIGFSRLIADALDAMAATPAGPPLLPDGHPLDLLVTATDFNGHPMALQLHSPPVVEETEHRLSIGFRKVVTQGPGRALAPWPELVVAARATASFPGAFPPLALREVDGLVTEREDTWPSRDAFIARIMPERHQRGEFDDLALIDGAVLVNAPFAEAIAVLGDRPAQREVDRRFVYIDPRPDAMHIGQRATKTVGFFSAILGSLSSIPREQPIRDNLEALRRQSDGRARLRGIVEALRPEIEEAVEGLFGRTFFLDRPNPKRLTAWRNRAQQAAAERAGFAFRAYAQVKLDGIVTALAQTIHSAAPDAASPDAVETALWRHLRAKGFNRLAELGGGATPETIAFFRAHDFAFRIRRIKMLARRLAHDWSDMAGIDPVAREAARDTVFRAQALYQARETGAGFGTSFGAIAARACEDPGGVLAAIAERRALTAIDLTVDAMLVESLVVMDRVLRRRVLLAYLGFPFYDVATLPLLQGDSLNANGGEFDPVKIDRISPDDAPSIRPGGTFACLRGVEFFNFGAFFSRAYRENDYLWGRLHGAERVIDLIASTVEEPLPPAMIRRAKHQAFLAVLESERDQLKAEPGLVQRLIDEVEAAFAAPA